MNKFGITILAAAIATALAATASAQTDRPRDASRPPAEATTPPGSPRDQENRKDVEKDRSDSDLAIERKCGELPEEARERCLKDARAQRDRGLPPSGTAATPAPPSASSPASSTPPSSSSSPTPGAPPSGSSSPSGGATGGSAAPPAGGARR